MINLLCALCALWNVFYLCAPLFTCLHVEDTVKIELHKIRSGDFLKICCADFCSFQKYDVTTKTYLFIKEKIILHHCKNGINLYHSIEYFFHFAHFVKNDQMIEIVDSFEHGKIKFTVWEPLFEFLSIGGGEKYVYMPLGFYEAKKCKRSHTKGNGLGVDPLCDNYGSIEFSLRKGETEPFYEGALQREQYVGSAKPAKTDANWNKPPPGNKFPCMENLPKEGNPKRYNHGDENNSCQVDPLMQLFNELMAEREREKNSFFHHSNTFVEEGEAYADNVLISYIAKKHTHKNTSKPCGSVGGISNTSLYLSHCLTPLIKNLLLSNPILIFLFQDPAICDLCAKRMTIVGETTRGGKKRYKKGSPPNYKWMIKFASLLFFLAILIATIWIFLKRKKCKMKDEKNPRSAKKRLAEIHVAYKSKIQTNFGSKIKDITDEDLINLIAHNKAELIIVCQP
ncbi:hypothetical protein C922_02183 [Plasmodium inui San Antonio 1]|uniref:Uncharacterized protein n=1 Tax=Plasmodium inui San Antonio 1 TaxID=1237626 RepID=W7A2M3_9APIC|nr:hypothetical protein C922_02183 [Plasmodium inui San Antonio 1]EUD67477.1 hypothetical protein C922_02183 [Plasmodium inui San Antonio 1]